MHNPCACSTTRALTQMKSPARLQLLALCLLTHSTTHQCGETTQWRFDGTIWICISSARARQAASVLLWHDTVASYAWCERTALPCNGVRSHPMGSKIIPSLYSGPSPGRAGRPCASLGLGWPSKIFTQAIIRSKLLLLLQLKTITTGAEMQRPGQPPPQRRSTRGHCRTALLACAPR